MRRRLWLLKGLFGGIDSPTYMIWSNVEKMYLCPFHRQTDTRTHTEARQAHDMERAGEDRVEKQETIKRREAAERNMNKP
jgi:hypothetical protein